jgi:electron transport complex protein RnfG
MSDGSLVNINGNLGSNKPPVEMPSSAAMIRIMGVVSLICGLLIVTTHLKTLDPIRRNQEIIMRESVEQLIPGIQKQIIYGVQPSGDLTILDGVQAAGPRFFAGYDHAGRLLGVVIESSERGYADTILAMFAYSIDKQAITGFKVLELKETPGLGDKISRDTDFLANFKNLDATLDSTSSKPAHPITVVKHGTKKKAWEIDAISGATISSRAVGRMLQRSVQEMVPVVVRNRDRIERAR